jgi:glycosyltransferase involved in cell wall biosynthesis
MSKSEAQSQLLNVLVATPSGTGGQGGIDRIMTSLRQELERQDRPDIKVRFLASRGAGHVGLSIFYVLGFCLWMLIYRITGRLDVVHINVSSYGSTYRKIIISLWARLLRTPYVLHLHGSEYRTFWVDDNGRKSRLIRSMFEHAGRVVVLGRVWRDFIAGRAPGSAAHVGGGNQVHILFLGRIGERKGVPQLLEALAQTRHLAGWRATIAGDGEVDAARAKAAELGLADRITFPGWVGPDEVALLIASADILVLPSFAENLPISVIEGMAAGLAVIATPVGAVEDIVTHEKTGLLVPPGDVPALSAALRRLIEDCDLRERLGAAAVAVHRELLELAPFAETLINIWKAAGH